MKNRKNIKTARPSSDYERRVVGGSERERAIERKLGSASYRKEEPIAQKNGEKKWVSLN